MSGRLTMLAVLVPMLIAAITRRVSGKEAAS